jgi:hypothetical protein
LVEQVATFIELASAATCEKNRKVIRAMDQHKHLSESITKLGSVAQSVEQWTENPCVGGSIPS